MNVREKKELLIDEIEETKSELLQRTLYNIKRGGEVSEELPGNLIEFYKNFHHLNYEWETREHMPNGEKVYGCINIKSAEAVLGSWEGTVYFKNIDHYDYMENFKVVDYFVAEACVGYIHDENRSDYMRFLFQGDTEAKPLGLDFAGYLELLFACRGYLYWQLVILHLRNGKGDESVVENFRTYMPQIFPEFKWEEFVGLWERVRIK